MLWKSFNDAVCPVACCACSGKFVVVVVQCEIVKLCRYQATGMVQGVVGYSSRHYTSMTFCTQSYYLFHPISNTPSLQKDMQLLLLPRPQQELISL